MSDTITPTSPNWRVTPEVSAANSAEGVVKKIPLPARPDTLMPAQIPAATAAFAVAVRKREAAEKALAQIKADQIARSRRIAVLTALKARLESQIIDAWCATWNTTLAPGDAVKTMEVPGFWNETGTPRTAVLYPDTSRQRIVSYVERSINIAPEGKGYPPHGVIAPAEAMTAASVFYNLAMEPGHLKWKPLWRYGIVTAVGPKSCSLILNAEAARPLSEDLAGMPLDGEGTLDERTLSNVPIFYPPCHSDVFAAGDEVLVVFQGYDRSKPKVIGFRRNPKFCGGITWQQFV